ARCSRVGSRCPGRTGLPPHRSLQRQAPPVTATMERDIHALAALPLTDHVAVVTGGGGLLGWQHAAALRDAGAPVVLADLAKSIERCDHGHLPEGPGDVMPVATDVVDPAQLVRLRDTILARFGRIDVLVNNAALDDKVEAPGMRPEDARFEQFPLDVWR